jgi:hypothetical protein
MGTIIEAHCKNCNLNKEKMYLGGGMYNYQTYAGFPYMCKKCEDIFVGNYLTDVMFCSSCRADKITPYNELKQDNISFEDENGGDTMKKYTVFEWRIDNDRRICLTNDYYKCPKCDEFSLKFKSIGCWD